MSVIKTNRNRSKTPHLIAYLITCIVLLLPISTLAFPTWVTVDPSQPQGSPPQIEILEHTNDHTTLQVSIPGFWCEDVYEGGEVFQKIWIPAYGTKMVDGKPELPVVRGLLGIPAPNNSAEVVATVNAWEHFYNYLVYPHQPDYVIGEPQPPFEWDEVFYQQDVWYPEDYALLSEPMKIREVVAVNNHIQCFQYNPAQEHLKVATQIVVTVSYVSSAFGSGNFAEDLMTSTSVHKDFLPLYESLMWNCNELGLGLCSPSTDYLIITANDYEDYLNPLITLLGNRGYSVHMVTMNEIPEGYSALAVYHYIKVMYNLSGIAYVLLVGDVPDLTPDFSGFEPYDPRQDGAHPLLAPNWITRE